MKAGEIFYLFFVIFFMLWDSMKFILSNINNNRRRNSNKKTIPDPISFQSKLTQNYIWD